MNWSVHNTFKVYRVCFCCACAQNEREEEQVRQHQSRDRAVKSLQRGQQALKQLRHERIVTESQKRAHIEAR